VRAILGLSAVALFLAPPAAAQRAATDVSAEEIARVFRGMLGCRRVT
jgi:hypothetical protein